MLYNEPSGLSLDVALANGGVDAQDALRSIVYGVGRITESADRFAAISDVPVLYTQLSPEHRSYLREVILTVLETEGGQENVEPAAIAALATTLDACDVLRLGSALVHQRLDSLWRGLIARHHDSSALAILSAIADAPQAQSIAYWQAAYHEMGKGGASLCFHGIARRSPSSAIRWLD